MPKKIFALAPDARQEECDHKSRLAYTGAVPCTGNLRCSLCGCEFDSAGKLIFEPLDPAWTPAKIYTKSHDWEAFIGQMHSGNVLEIDGEIYYYFLEVLPPIFMHSSASGQNYSFGFAEGEESIVGFWPDGKGHYYCKDTGKINRA